MNTKEIQAKAKKLGINTKDMKKSDLIRAIQSAENNIPCYGTDRISICGEYNCLWRDNCVKANNK